MRTYFESVTSREVLRFTCSACQKPGRTKTIEEEFTVNPFNRRADGTPRTRAEVQTQAKEALANTRELFLAEPMCRSCDDALSWDERTALGDRRRLKISGRPND